jgi:hypothetical protein
MMPVVEVAMVVWPIIAVVRPSIVRAVRIVPRRAELYADAARSRIETNLCCGRHSRADRDYRHKFNNKLSRDCLLRWLHLQVRRNPSASFRLFGARTCRMPLSPVHK